MRAFHTASGGVIFVPDEVEREQKPVSYADLFGDKSPAEKPAFMSRLFGKRIGKNLKKAA